MFTITVKKKPHNVMERLNCISFSSEIHLRYVGEFVCIVHFPECNENSFVLGKSERGGRSLGG